MTAGPCVSLPRNGVTQGTLQLGGIRRSLPGTSAATGKARLTGKTRLGNSHKGREPRSASVPHQELELRVRGLTGGPGHSRSRPSPSAPWVGQGFSHSRWRAPGRVSSSALLLMDASGLTRPASAGISGAWEVVSGWPVRRHAGGGKERDHDSGSLPALKAGEHVSEEIADGRDGLASLDDSVLVDVRHGLAEFLPERQAHEEERLAQSAQRRVV